MVVRERPKRRALIEKTIAPEADGRFVVCFENEDTAKLKPREYVWDVRLAIQANVDDSGKVTDAEQIITPCPPGIVFVLAAWQGAVGRRSKQRSSGSYQQTLRFAGDAGSTQRAGRTVKRERARKATRATPARRESRGRRATKANRAQRASGARRAQLARHLRSRCRSRPASRERRRASRRAARRRIRRSNSPFRRGQRARRVKRATREA